MVDKDYTIPNNVNNNAIITFVNDLTLGDVVLIKTKSKLKNENGYYELPHPLERNPKNDNLFEFTLGEVNDHVAKLIVENLDNFEGIYPGVSNLRDISNLSIE